MGRALPREVDQGKEKWSKEKREIRGWRRGSRNEMSLR